MILNSYRDINSDIKKKRERGMVYPDSTRDTRSIWEGESTGVIGRLRQSTYPEGGAGKFVSKESKDRAMALSDMNMREQQMRQQNRLSRLKPVHEKNTEMIEAQSGATSYARGLREGRNDTVDKPTMNKKTPEALVNGILNDYTVVNNAVYGPDGELVDDDKFSEAVISFHNYARQDPVGEGEVLVKDIETGKYAVVSERDARKNNAFSSVSVPDNVKLAWGAKSDKRTITRDRYAELFEKEFGKPPKNRDYKQAKKDGIIFVAP